MKDIKYMVRVSCMTYNQALYVEDAMNGFCMQETNFPFVCTIIDDCSTEGEQDVIKGYLKAHFDLEDSSVVRNEETDDYYLTFAQHKTNKNCYFAVLFLKYNHYSIRKPKMPYIEEWCDTKYVALCEGDDYWTEPSKLQKQVDYLESHPDVGLVHTDFEFVNTEGQVVDGGMMAKHYKSNIKNGYIWQDYLKGAGYILTCTVMYRKKLLIGEKQFIDHGQYMMMERQMKVYHLPEKTANYRINPNGMMQSRLDYVSRQAGRAIFYQLYYYSVDHVNTNPYYYRNIGVLYNVTKAIIRKKRELPLMELEEAKEMFKTIVRKNLLTLVVFAPIVIPVMVFEKCVHYFKKAK